jgi:transposase-like protein
MVFRDSAGKHKPSGSHQASAPALSRKPGREPAAYRVACSMTPLCYRRHRFPPEIIQHAIWLYLRFTLSYRDVEELLAERGLDISYETVRRWVLKFGPAIARRLRQRRPRPSDRWHLDEMVVRIAGERMYLWRAVDHEGEVLDMLVAPTRHPGGAAADAQAAQEARFCTEIAGHRQAALLHLRVPASATDLPA